MATDGASVCLHVCAMFPVDLGNRNEHITSRGAIGWMLLMGQDDRHPHLLGISKTTAQPRYPPQQQQRYSSSTTTPVLQTLAFVAATVLLPSCVFAVFTRRYVQSLSRSHVLYDFQSNTCRRTSSCHTAPVDRSTQE